MMRVYHQCGHNFIWNIQSLQDDSAGHGLIISPVNIEAERISEKIPTSILSQSWLDPQFYLPGDNKGKLATYEFFPANVIEEFSTSDFETRAFEIARSCLSFQHDHNFSYFVIPTRYFNEIPDNHLEQLEQILVDPFLSAKEAIDPTRPILLTVIAKTSHLEPGPRRDELLTWATKFSTLKGIYLIFEKSFQSKQIKDPEFLVNALEFIQTLRANELEVHLGYTGLESLLFSVADPTSVSVGSYENLRSFDIQRLQTRDPEVRNQPTPRIYSGRLLQWIENTYIPPFRRLIHEWHELFDDSPYKEYLLANDMQLNSQRSEIYKHYFYVFFNQVSHLPTVQERASYVSKLAESALELFDEIKASGVYLDSDSDGSHLPAWLNAISMYNA